MKDTLLLFGVLIGGLFSSTAQSDVPFWLDEKVNEENREPMHASYFVYENEALAKKGDWTLSDNYLDINGKWKFKWLENARDLPIGFEKLNYDDSHWDDFKIPANCEMNLIR